MANRYCFYHEADLDGWCSAALVAKHFDWKYIELIPIDYHIEFPWDKIDETSEVWMVDYCLQPFSDMVELFERCGRMVWIDHHKSALKKFEEYLDGGISAIEGYRDLKYAGCELTWMFLNNSIPAKEYKGYTSMPLPVYYLGRYDIWRWQGVGDALEFQMGMKALPRMEPITVMNDYSLGEINTAIHWNKLLSTSTNSMVVMDIVEKGRTILQYQEVANAESAKRQCFFGELYTSPVIGPETKKMSVIAANVPKSSSQYFDSVLEQFPEAEALCTFRFGGGKWTFSLYEIPDRNTRDLSEIAITYGGGGHKGAAGFVVDENRFHLKDFIVPLENKKGE